MNLKNLMDNPYVVAIGWFCTISAFLFCIYTWITGKKRKEISYFKNSREVVKGGKSTIPDLRLSYKNKNINDMTITKLAIWNSGNEVLKQDDIVDIKPLKIITSDKKVEFLDARIICEGEETNQFSIKEFSNKYINIDFDYMNAHDGIVIQLLHTGNPSIDVDCKIKGGKEIKNINWYSEDSNTAPTKKKRTSIITIGLNLILTISVAVLLVLTQWGVIPPEVLWKMPFDDNIIINSIFTAVFIILIVAMIVTSYKFIKTMYHIDIPSKLRRDISYDEI